MSEEKKISLNNCDFKNKKTRLTSPHSLIACRLIGVNDDDLYFQTLDEYIKNNVECQYLERDLQEERYNHFEKNRKELIELAKNQREFLIKEEESKKHNTISNTTTNINNYNISGTLGNTHNKTFKKNSSYGNLDTYGESSTAIKLEREKLRRLKEKQELNVKLLIDYECFREENRRKNMEKMRIQEEKEERKKEEEELERKRRIFEREKKEEEFRNKINKMNEQQYERLREKEKELNRKDIKRKKNLQKLRTENYKKLTEKRQFLQNKINKALNRNELKMQEKINEYLEKQKKMEELKEQKELEKIIKLREQNEENLKKSQKIKKVLEQNDEIIRQKIERYNKKMEEIQKRKEEKEKEEMKQMEEEKRKKEEKEKRLIEVRSKYEQILVDNREKIMNKIIKIDEKIKNQKLQQEKNLHKKYNQLFLSREDRKNRVMRSERVKDFERSVKMDMINARMQRIENMQKDRYMLEQERRNMEDGLSNKKTLMLKRLEKVMKDDRNMTKDEITDFVFNDVKPGHKNKDEENKRQEHKDININDNTLNVPGAIEEKTKI